MRRFTVLLALLAGTLCQAAQALDVELTVGSVSMPGVPGTLTDIRLACRLEAEPGATACRDGTLRARWQGQQVEADLVRGRVDQAGRWALEANAGLRKFTFAEDTGKIATDALDLDAWVTAKGDSRRIEADVRAAIPRGQAYVEPVFVDFGAAPATIQAHVVADLRTKAFRADPLRVEQRGILRVSGSVAQRAGGRPDADLRIEELLPGPAFTTWAQPFLAGKGIEKSAFTGRMHGRVVVTQGAPQAVDLHLDDVAAEIPTPDLGMSGLEGDLHWRADGDVEPSALRWRDARFAKLVLGASDLSFRTRGRDVAMLAPLRVPVAGGALVVHALTVSHAGAADMTARFDGEIEPIDLATLCRALGWPEFGGQLAGRLPGLHLEDRELALDGALTARAFDGTITVDGLKMLDPFGRVPRLLAGIHLRGLDLAAVTGAFSFGKIEGRLDGDVEGLRLLDWEPVEFRARLGTPKGDRSRHRISQRAIDNISSIGGGPTGLLSRGAMRFFKDFAYDRIGWSCELRDGVCNMGGLGPAKDGGYVLVKGRLLPRIDVIGYETRVDWSTFVEQLKAARETQGVEVR